MRRNNAHQRAAARLRLRLCPAQGWRRGAAPPFASRSHLWEDSQTPQEPPLPPVPRMPSPPCEAQGRSPAFICSRKTFYRTSRRGQGVRSPPSALSAVGAGGQRWRAGLDDTVLYLSRF